MEKKSKKEKDTCAPSNQKLWCITIMAIAIIVLTWLPSFNTNWSRIVVTVIASLMFIRSMMVNCCK